MAYRPKIAVIMANLGTPDAPTPAAVRKFLKQFLSDQRVIEIPKLLWQVILRCFVLPFRPKKVAQGYAAIWQTDSPMREILFQQVGLTQQQIKQDFPDLEVNVIAAMTYGSPNIQDILQNIAQQNYDHVLLLPLFPQYSATSTAPLYDALAKWSVTQRNLPGISIIRDYYAHPAYIDALAQSVQKFQAEHGPAEKLLMSFHGIPQPYADKGDPYADRCQETAKRVAEKLNLQTDQWAISFQSRFGKQEWVKPYTNELLTQWAQQGIKSVQIMSPAFSADCLETLEELAVENRGVFLTNGGQDYAYIPALNTDSGHLDLFHALLAPQLTALSAQFAK
ncbi:ferrochelatase [Acinetobacter qingfengensis]|uniref:Ferrochelatase n=1 Tax=Acinetobacter qingfengensis TaxID=1262585 RepID=A0A1E7R1I4_9GAMM|nr:ferrochelatase [Acinetobacter qingfengensis]KAA8733344.1 ferrochelatase [Acinetobacter qingfengensis]OEY93170.1 ferrochelatase [Acinetobacter qingfengensis]